MRKSEADTSQIILPFNFSRGAPNLTSSSNTCTLTTVSTAAGAISGKRLSDSQESVILPAIPDFLARIWAQHRSRVVQASLCPVSSSGFPPNSAYQPSCGVIVDVTVRINKRYPRAWVGCIPVLIPSSNSLCNIVYCDPPSSLKLGRGSPRSCELDVQASYAHLYTFLPCWAFPAYGRQLGFSDPGLFFIGAVVWMPSDMVLNRAQMLVRDSEALAQFRVDHRIPDDVVIERPGPNDDVDWVEREGNRMPIRTWFIYQAGLRFSLSKLLRTVLSTCGLTFMQVSVNFVRTVLAPRRNPETQMLEGNHYLCLRKPNQPQTRLVTDSPDKDQYLNDFIWVSGQWEFPVDEPDPFSVPRHWGYIPIGFNRRFWRRSDQCSTAISAVNNCGRSRKVSDLLGYIPLYRYTISLRAARQGRPVLPPLQIRGPGSRRRSSLFDEVSDLFEGTSAELRRLLEEAEGESSGSSESSSSSWDIDLGDEALNEEAEVKDGKEVDQIPAAAPLVPAPLVLVPEPINLPSSDSDIAIVKPRKIVEHSYSHSDSSSAGSQLNAEIMAPKSIALSLMGGKRKEKQPAEGTSRPKRGKGAGSAAGTPELWAPQFAAIELGKQVTYADTSKDHETCVALGNAVMLPQDVADHAAETTAEFGGKLVMLGAQLFQWAVSSSLQLKHGVVDLKKANQKANNLEKELKQTQSELTDARSAAEIAILQRNHAQQETSNLKAFACGEVYKKLFDRAFERARNELQIPLNHPAWLSPAPPVQLPASPERYSPINLPNFNEEEYVTLLVDEGNINTAAVEAHAGIAETANRDRDGEAEVDRAVEAEGENLV
ncbi:hypothetical protein Acr_00g0053650 [Actinidia rufa]|uniref:Uncharacterized protein n=1 Tax=Actinidia rufa TaxID=165716 RepID=A0A7J0DNE0_9ERIC|nr:hypothetical protein Acr_00g0053650 [Actinidia rufa]